MLSDGRHPFGNPVDCQHNILHNKPQLTHGLLRVGNGMDLLIRKMLMPLPEHRPSSDILLNLCKRTHFSHAYNVLSSSSFSTSFYSYNGNNDNEALVNGKYNSSEDIMVADVRLFLQGNLPGLFIIKTKSRNIFVDRISEGIGMLTFPVIEFSPSEADNNVDFENESEFCVAKVNYLRNEHLSVLSNFRKKVIVLVYDTNCSGALVKVVIDFFAWNHLSHQFQKNLAEQVMTYSCHNSCQAAKIIGRSMQENPKIYENLGKQNLKALVKLKVTRKAFAFLIHTFMNHHINAFCKLRHYSRSEIIYALLPQALAASPNLLQVSYFIINGIIDGCSQPYKLRCKCFEDFIVAQVINTSGEFDVVPENLLETFCSIDCINSECADAEFKHPMVLEFLELFASSDAITNKVIKTLLTQNTEEFLQACLAGGFVKLLKGIVKQHQHIFSGCAFSIPKDFQKSTKSFIDLTRFCLGHKISVNFGINPPIGVDSSMRNKWALLHFVILRNDFKLFEQIYQRYYDCRVNTRRTLIHVVSMCVSETDSIDKTLQDQRLKMIKLISLLHSNSFPIKQGELNVQRCEPSLITFMQSEYEDIRPCRILHYSTTR